MTTNSQKVPTTGNDQVTSKDLEKASEQLKSGTPDPVVGNGQEDSEQLPTSTKEDPKNLAGKEDIEDVEAKAKWEADAKVQTELNAKKKKEANAKAKKEADAVSDSLKEIDKKWTSEGIATHTMLAGRDDVTEEEKQLFNVIRENIGVTPGKLKKIIQDKDQVKEYGLSKDQEKLIKKILKSIEKTAVETLDVSQVPDEVREVIQHYGISFAMMKDSEAFIEFMDSQEADKKDIAKAKELVLEFYESIAYE